MGIFSRDPESLRQKALERARKEADKIGGLSVSGEARLRVRDDVSFAKYLRESLVPAVPFLGGRAPEPDVIQVITLAGKGQEFGLVIPWSNRLVLPHEFYSILPGRLPSCLALARHSFGGVGIWMGGNGGTDAPLAEAAKKQGRYLSDGVNWSLDVGFNVLKIAWGIQAIPLGESEYVHLAQTAPLGLYGGKFGFAWYLDRRAAFASFVSALNVTGDFTFSAFFPAFSYVFLAKVFEKKTGCTHPTEITK